MSGMPTQQAKGNKTNKERGRQGEERRDQGRVEWEGGGNGRVGRKRGVGFGKGEERGRGRGKGGKTLECCDSLVKPTASDIKALRFPGSSCRHLLVAKPPSSMPNTHTHTHTHTQHDDTPEEN